MLGFQILVTTIIFLFNAHHHDFTYVDLVDVFTVNRISPIGHTVKKARIDTSDPHRHELVAVTVVVPDMTGQIASTLVENILKRDGVGIRPVQIMVMV